MDTYLIRNEHGIGAAGPRSPRTLALSALLCPVCFGANDAPMAQAMNWGVLTLLAITIVVLATFGAFFVNLARRGGCGIATADRERGAPPARSAASRDRSRSARDAMGPFAGGTRRDALDTRGAASR